MRAGPATTAVGCALLSVAMGCQPGTSATRPAGATEAERPPNRASPPARYRALLTGETPDTTETSVELTLVTESAPFVPGTRARIAALFRIPDASHIYWSNPGATGLATRATFTAPTGYEVGPTEYPAPTGFESERGVASYGYAGTTALFAELTVPAGASMSPVHLEVAASWLSCSDVCVKEEGRASLEVPLGLTPSPSAASSELAPHLALLPRPLSTTPDVQVVVEDTQMTVTAQDGDRLTFFPDADRGVANAVHMGAAQLTVAFAPGGASLSGVLRVESAAGTRAFAIGR